MRIAIASDHAGVRLKAEICAHLQQCGHEVYDLGPSDTASVDYPEYASKAGAYVLAGKADSAVLVCGTGMGMGIAANKMRGIRAVVCSHAFTAQMARIHNDANVLCLGERVVGTGLALSIVDAFFASTFEGGRHARRVAQIAALEEGLHGESSQSSSGCRS